MINKRCKSTTFIAHLQEKCAKTTEFALTFLTILLHIFLIINSKESYCDSLLQEIEDN